MTQTDSPSQTGNPLLESPLDIISIHVIAGSANKSETLNGVLRAHGLAVEPLWLDAIENWQGTPAELVFYFADTDGTTLVQAIAHADREGAALIVVAPDSDPEAAARALAAGADDWVRLEDSELLAEATLRERRRRRRRERLRVLRRSSERAKQFLQTQFGGSRDAIALLVNGIVAEANAACAACCGLANPGKLVGLRFIDLFTPADQFRLKRDMRALLEDRQSRVVKNLTLRRRGGDECEVDVTLAATLDSDETGILVRIAENGAKDEAARYLQALESEKERLKNELAGLRDAGSGTRLLLPAAFASIAAEQIGQSSSDSVRGLAIIRPADPQAALAAFGLLGTAEVNANIAAMVASLLDERDFATRIGDSNFLALIVRPDVGEAERWVESLLRNLGEETFAGDGHSAHLDFVAGYVAVDRGRRLDLLIQEAQKAADGASAGTVSRGKGGTGAVTVDDSGWETLIREALESHRYKVALLPIEDLASGLRSWAALPRLLDHGGKEIAAELFQPPAERLGLLPVLERRLVGHALRALLTKQSSGAVARVIVPLHAATLADVQFFDFLNGLLAHVGKSLPPKSLVLELDIGQIPGRMRELEQFAERATARTCALGLRGYAPQASNKSMELLPIQSLRMTPAVTERLAAGDETTAIAIKEAATRLAVRGIRLIAGGVADTHTMAKLYNLGVGTVEGPAIGDSELFRPK